MKLYVERKVLNSEEITKWFENQGVVVQHDLHLTVQYCKKDIEIDQFVFDDKNLIIDNSYSKMEIFGDYQVELLYDIRLFERFNYFKKKGTSFDFPFYRPHISIAKNISVDLKPYPIILLGKEEWSELDEDWS